MKANELMIGDWVNLKNGKVIMPCQVTVIGHSTQDRDDIGTTVCVDLSKEFPTCIFDMDAITPIPLTPEILEKNGFTHSFGDLDFYDYEKWEKKVDDKTIRVIKDHDGWFCRVDDNKLTRSMGIAPYVHTMQNIIRIGGIKKSIEL